MKVENRTSAIVRECNSDFLKKIELRPAQIITLLLIFKHIPVKYIQAVPGAIVSLEKKTTKNKK